MRAALFVGVTLAMAACGDRPDDELPTDSSPDTDPIDTDPPSDSVMLSGAWYLPPGSSVMLAHPYRGDQCERPFLTDAEFFRFRWADSGEPLSCDPETLEVGSCRIQLEFPDEQAGDLRVVAHMASRGCAGMNDGRVYQVEALVPLPYRRVADVDPDRDVIEVFDTRFVLAMLDEQVLLFMEEGRPETQVSLARDNTFESLPP